MLEFLVKLFGTFDVTVAYFWIILYATLGRLLAGVRTAPHSCPSRIDRRTLFDHDRISYRGKMLAGVMALRSYPTIVEPFPAWGNSSP